MKVVPLEGGPWSLLMNCKMWHWMGGGNVDSIAMWGVIFVHSEAWRAKVRVHKASK